MIHTLVVVGVPMTIVDLPDVETCIYIMTALDGKCNVRFSPYLELLLFELYETKMLLKPRFIVGCWA